MKKLIWSLLLGAILGVVCIVGASLRSQQTLSASYLFAFWYNRLLIGLVIGLLPKQSYKALFISGVILGTVVSFAFYASTNFQDVVGFIAGMVYGAIIPIVLHFVLKEKNNPVV